MYSFLNDYSEGAAPQVLERLARCAREQNAGYGEDDHCRRAAEYLRDAMKRPGAAVHFLAGGTQSNLTVISSLLRPHQAAIAAASGHINTHETGAIEATGHKVLTREAPDGKLTPEMLRSVLDEHTDEHMVQPKLVYLSQSTEVGTIYSRCQLGEIRRFCLEHGLWLFLDGARLGAALVAPENDLTLADIAELTDVFYVGGTKNGALCGEAVVFTTPQPDFRFAMKQRGALAAKGFVLGEQFEALFENDLSLYLDFARHARAMAKKLADGVAGAGYSFLAPPQTNQVFPILPEALVEKLEEHFAFIRWSKPAEGQVALRLVASWATPPEAVEKFVDLLQ